MAQGVHRRSRCRIVARYRAVRSDPEDLARQRGGIGGGRRRRGVSRRDVEHAVGPEGQPPAVVDRRFGNPGENRLGGTQRPARPRHAHHAVVRGGGEIGIQPTVGIGDPQQTSFAARHDVVQLAHLRDGILRDEHDAGGVTLTDHRGAVREERRERQAPRRLQSGGDSPDYPDRRRGAGDGSRRALRRASGTAPDDQQRDERERGQPGGHIPLCARTCPPAERGHSELIFR